MIRIEVPQELADALVAERVAIRPGTKGPTAELLIDTATTVATTISLLQGPETFAKLAAMIKSRFGGPKAVTLTVKGKRGDIRIILSEDTDLEGLAKMIKDGLVGDLD
jgi:hypothetical protein